MLRQKKSASCAKLQLSSFLAPLYASPQWRILFATFVLPLSLGAHCRTASRRSWSRSEACWRTASAARLTSELSEVAEGGQEHCVRPIRPRLSAALAHHALFRVASVASPTIASRGRRPPFRFAHYVHARLRSVVVAITTSRSRVPTRIEWRCPMAVQLRCSLLHFAALRGCAVTPTAMLISPASLRIWTEAVVLPLVPSYQVR